MGCEYCGNTGRHEYRCPNYVEPKAEHYCSICNEGIYDGEEYIKNDEGEYAHWDCIDYGRELVEWLGYKIHKMGDI